MPSDALQRRWWDTIPPRPRSDMVAKKPGSIFQVGARLWVFTLEPLVMRREINMLEPEHNQKRRRGGSNGGRVARKRVAKKPKFSPYGPTILWDAQQQGASMNPAAHGEPSTTYLDEMATIALAGDPIELLEEDFRREMRIDAVKRATQEFDPCDGSEQEKAAFRALNEQLDVEMFRYHEALVTAGRARKWPIFVKMYGFFPYQAEIMVETGKCIVEELYEDLDTGVIN